MHLLYVDDDRINLLLFETACAAVPGLQLSTAVSGAEALDIARETPPQVLVIDLHLPDTDGHALLQALRRELAPAEVAAFLCTADEGDEVLRAAVGAGFTGCWRKPVDRQTLRQGLAALGHALTD